MRNLKGVGKSTGSTKRFNENQVMGLMKTKKNALGMYGAKANGGQEWDGKKERRGGIEGVQ